MEYSIHSPPMVQFWYFLIILTLRYFIIAALIHGLVWYVLRQRVSASLIKQNPPANSTIRREIFYSLLALPVFAASAFVVAWGNKYGFSSVDVRPFIEHGWLRASLYFVVLILLHDTYFYWLHRWMHRPTIFKHVHRVHHLSNYPSAFAAYSFHPLESVLEMLFFPVALILLPGVHIYTFVAFFTFDFIINSLAHSGVEYLPARVRNSAWGKWLNTATLHGKHHANSQGNYGFYFSFWDRVCGTLRV